MSAKKSDKTAANLSFELAIKRLEEIVDHLEKGDLNLETALDSFEEGMQLAKICDDKLHEAGGRVEKIMKDFSGKEKVVPMEFDKNSIDESDDGDEEDNDEDF